MLAITLNCEPHGNSFGDGGVLLHPDTSGDGSGDHGSGSGIVLESEANDEETLLDDEDFVFGKEDNYCKLSKVW